jgi:hypothetical protein
MRVVLTISLGFVLVGFFAMSCDSPPSEGGAGGASAYVTGTGGSVCGANYVSEPVNEQGGCTPAPMTGPQIILQGPFGMHAFCLGNRQYFLQVNQWNTSASSTDTSTTVLQELTYGGGSYYYKVTKQLASTSFNSGPTGFPSMYIGANSGHTTLNNGMPKLVSSIASVPTTWTWADNGATDSADNTYNVTYDVWFSANATGDPTASQPSGGYLMVWLHKPSRAQPIGGSPRYSGLTITGIPGTWDAWVGNGPGSVPCISYVRTDINPAYSMSFDLNLFIRDAVQNRANTITDTMYLTNIFSGFEIWTGGLGLETTSFCAAVL